MVKDEYSFEDEYSFVIEPLDNVPLPSQETIQSGDIVVGLSLEYKYRVGIVREVGKDSFSYDVAYNRPRDPSPSHNTYKEKYEYVNESTHSTPVLFLRKKEGRLELVAANTHYTEGLVKLRESHLESSAKEVQRRVR